MLLRTVLYYAASLLRLPATRFFRVCHAHSDHAARPPTPTPATRAAGLAGLLTTEVVLGSLLFVLAFGLFFYLTRVVFQEHSQTFDNWGFAQMDRLRAAQPWTYGVMKFITFFGSVKFFVPASLLVPLLLHRRGFGRYAVELLLSMGGGLALNELLKFYFHPRPPIHSPFLPVWPQLSERPRHDEHGLLRLPGLAGGAA